MDDCTNGRFVRGGTKFTGGIDWWYCSECYTQVSEFETHYAYCPYCGKKMDAHVQ